MIGTSATFRRYLRLLGVDHAGPCAAALAKLVSAHLCRVPFENVTKLLLISREGNGRVREIEEYLDGIENLDLGGTCHTNNPFFAELLRWLGYEAGLLGADMSIPNVHTVLRVRADGADYHVDCGYGGPFREPVRLNRMPWETSLGPTRYLFKRREEDGRVQLDVIFDGERIHGYLAHDIPRSFDFFRETILSSFQPGRTFVSRLRIARFFPDHAVELTNGTLIRHDAAQSTMTELNNLAELKEAIAVDLAMPRCPIEEAVRTLERLTGSPFFDAGATGRD